MKVIFNKYILMPKNNKLGIKNKNLIGIRLYQNMEIGK
jgi:hypothetical protein